VCPVCGADAEHHNAETLCIGDVDRVVAAANSEIDKIEARADDLSATISTLEIEKRRLENALPKIEANLQKYSAELKNVVSPNLRKLRTSYKELADKGASVREALGLFDSLQDLNGRKAALERVNTSPSGSAEGSSRLTDTMVSPFSLLVEETLKSWGFPGGDRVHFDTQVKDLVIAGKPRVSYGKGLRAITQAAFSISLLEYCISRDSPHPGFIILDSPLLSYKEPESVEDDLSDTNLNSNFYRYLLQIQNSMQIIIIENTDPPSDVELGGRVEHFSGIVGEGRFGLFPT